MTRTFSPCVAVTEKKSKDTELQYTLAAGRATTVKMLISYHKIMWTVGTACVRVCASPTSSCWRWVLCCACVCECVCECCECPTHLVDGGFSVRVTCALFCCHTPGGPCAYVRHFIALSCWTVGFPAKNLVFPPAGAFIHDGAGATSVRG